MTCGKMEIRDRNSNKKKRYIPSWTEDSLNWNWNSCSKNVCSNLLYESYFYHISVASHFLLLGECAFAYTIKWTSETYRKKSLWKITKTKERTSSQQKYWANMISFFAADDTKRCATHSCTRANIRKQTHMHMQKRHSGSHLFVDLFGWCFVIVCDFYCHLSGFGVQHRLAFACRCASSVLKAAV